jgi:hypothetical protein
MHRLTVVLVLIVAVVLLGAGSASAGWDPTERRPGGVAVAVHQAGGPGAYSVAGGSSGIACRYSRYPKLKGFVPPSIPIGTPDPHAGEPGAWYASICTDGIELWLGDLWVPANQPAVAPAVLAQLARRYLPLPPPSIQTSPAATTDQVTSIQTSPAATTDQVTNVPTWLWVDPATWGVRTATASVPNESATVTATPVSVTWTMGDGSRVVCRGPGTPYAGGDPARPSPDCGHTYRQSSARQPGLRYPVTATTSWRITWVASGVVAASGSLAPLLRTATTTLRVAEAQTVN